jgi:hypothetical protein
MDRAVTATRVDRVLALTRKGGSNGEVAGKAL